MARSLFTSLSCFFFLLFSCYTGHQVLGEEHEYMSSADFKKASNASQFRVFWHDIVNGTDGTSVVVLHSNSSTFFGAINMIDDALTIGPNLSSKTVGRAEGFYVWAGQQEISLVMVMNFKFTEGKYNGSSISIVGRNPFTTLKVREMPIVGGTGLFRFASGYVQAKTYSWAPDGDDSYAIVEYNGYVIH